MSQRRDTERCIDVAPLAREAWAAFAAHDVDASRQRPLTHLAEVTLMQAIALVATPRLAFYLLIS